MYMQTIKGRGFTLSSLISRVENRRAGFGFDYISCTHALSLASVSNHMIQTIPRFQLQPRRTQHAVFPHSVSAPVDFTSRFMG